MQIFTRYVVTFSMLYLILLAALFHKSGILIGGEAQKYISAAQLIINQSDYSGIERRWLYSSYILLLALLIKIGFNFYGIIIFQILLNLLCSYLVIIILLRLTKSIQIGYYGSVMFLLCLPIQQWTMALYTESFFTSLIIIYSFLLTSKIDKWSSSVLIIVALLISFCRPVGIFIAISGLLAVNSQFTNKIHAFYIPSIITILIAIFISGFFIPLDCEQVAIPILQGSVIYGLPEWNSGISILPPCNLLNVYKIMVEEHGYLEIISLFFKKIESLYTFTRPYYSLMHNSVLSMHYILFVTAIIGLLSNNKIVAKFRYYFLSSISFLTIVAGFTHDEWSARFQVPILVFVIFFAAVGLDEIISKFKKTYSDSLRRV